MHVGMAAVFQNPGKAQSDRDVYLNELRSRSWPSRSGSSRCGAWSTTSPTTRCAPTSLQFLSYMAGRTRHAQLGSMVVVLPVARPNAGGRGGLDARQPVGRPAHPRAGPRRGQGGVRRLPAVDGRESRRCFVESARCCCEGSRPAYCEYDGGPTSSSRARPSGPRRSRASAGAPTRRRSRRSRADHGRAGRRHPDHPPEAVEGSGERADAVHRALPRGQRSGRAAADLGGLDGLRRERRPRPRDGAALHRRLLPDRARPLPVPGRPPADTRGLRVLRQDGREDPRLRRPRTSSTSSWISRCGARPSSATRRSSTCTRARATATTSASSATRACRTTRRSATCASSPEVMPALQKLDTAAAEPGRRRPPRSRGGLGP